jgi:hypothetical protein
MGNDKLKQFSESRKLYNKEASKESTRRQLKQQLKKKMTTILVGCVDEIEKFFGDIWGHGLHSDEKTDNQLDATPIWNQCRDKMFDRGNAQIRGMEKELDGYDLEVIRNEYKFEDRSKFTN